MRSGVREARRLRCFVWCLVGLLALLGQASRADGSAHVLDPDTGVEIVTVAEEKMFPDNWYQAPIPPRVTSLRPEAAAYPTEIVEQELHKYPSAFVSANLKTIYLVHDLVFHGVELGGLNWLDQRRIYISVGDMDFPDAAGWLRCTVHHEFAHVLAGNHMRNFRALGWARLNLHDYHYGNGFVEAIRRGRDGSDSTAISEEYLKKGFIREYSMASIAEDYATICEHLLSGDPALLDATEKYGVIRHKVEAVKRFYASLDPFFTADYFTGLQQQRLRDIVLACLGISIAYHDGRPQLNVEKDTVAERSGLKNGDRFLSVSELALKEIAVPIGTISSLPERSKIAVTVQRAQNGNPLPVNLETNFSLWIQTTMPGSVEMPYGGMFLPASIPNALRQSIQVKTGSRVMVNPDNSFYIIYPDPSGKPSF